MSTYIILTKKKTDTTFAVMPNVLFPTMKEAEEWLAFEKKRTIDSNEYDYRILEKDEPVTMRVVCQNNLLKNELNKKENRVKALIKKFVVGLLQDEINHQVQLELANMNDRMELLSKRVNEYNQIQKVNSLADQLSDLTDTVGSIQEDVDNHKDMFDYVTKRDMQKLSDFDLEDMANDIEELNKFKDDFDGADLSDLQTDVEDVKSRLDTLEEQDLQSSIDDLKEEFTNTSTDFETRIGQLEIGDSQRLAKLLRDGFIDLATKIDTKGEE